MEIGFLFLFNSFSLGVGLAMDAFSVSLVNGMNDPRASRWKSIRIAGVYAFFQALMPMLGWFCTHTIIQAFTTFHTCIPWISLMLLSFIGISMIRESRAEPEVQKFARTLTRHILFLQGIATSIDAFSVGFTIADYAFPAALLCSLIIASVTWLICTVGVELGKQIGDRLAGRATFFGGVLLICVGIEILLTHLF